jgi:engulfment/cell motility protein 1
LKDQPKSNTANIGTQSLDYTLQLPNLVRDIMEDSPDVVTLISGLRSDKESARKYAVFKLQALLSDPSFADAFVQADGVLSLREAVMQTTGNTQAYALGSLDKLLELDMGWEGVDVLVIEKVRCS